MAMSVQMCRIRKSFLWPNDGDSRLRRSCVSSRRLPGAPDTPLPAFLGRYTWVDMRAGLDDEHSLGRLLSGICGLPPGSDEPAALPDLKVLSDPGLLPPGSRLPLLRNALFTSRTEALKELARILLSSAAPTALVTQAISGMGGVGKTQLAVEFAYRYRRFFQGVHWVDASVPLNIAAEIALCGTAMNLSDWPTAMYYHYWTAGQPVRPSHYGIRTREHKLIYYYGLVRDEGRRSEDCWEFYNLARDPYELTNRYSDPGYAARVGNLRSRLDALRQECGDTADPVTTYPMQLTSC
jgi:hypothetical protein